MKKWLLHIYIGVLGILAASCSNQEVAPDSAEREEVHITFTLAINGNTAARAWDGNYDADEGNDYDNHIAPGSLQVLICDTEGNPLAQVDKLWWHQIEGNISVYRFTGVVESNRLTTGTYKIMVFANCPSVSMSDSFNKIQDLEYNQSATSIPMWGVIQTKLTLTPGADNDLGTIHILRAMAKVKVALSDEMSGEYELAEVSFTNYNTKGYCLPSLSSFGDLMTTTELDTEGVLRPYSSGGSRLLFNNGVVYVPEYQNDGNLSIAVLLKHSETDRTKKYSISFSEYNNGMAGTAMDVIRNHYYSFVVTAVTPDDVEAKVFYNVELWDSKTINIPGFK